MSKTLEFPGKLCDVQQAADLLGVNPGTIRRWAQSGTLGGLKIGVRGDWRFTHESLLQLVRTQDSIQDAPVGPDLPASAHEVQFYNDESYLINSLADYVAEGLRNGEVCVVIATKSHAERLEAELQTAGISLAAAKSRRHYILHDAQQTLDSFMVDGLPDRDKFRASVGSIVRTVCSTGQPVRAYGEMVAVLWSQGNLAALIRLEELWNELAAEYQFTLLCGYSMVAFHELEDAEAFAQINHRHTKVIPTESHSRSDDPTHQLRSIAVLQQQSLALQHDITQRRQALQELELQTSQLLAEQDRLQKLNRAKDEFISIASHQLRTPATGVKQYIGMLMEGYFGELSADQAQYLAKAYDSNERQIKVVNDLLLIAKVDAGTIHLTHEEHDLVGLITDVADEQSVEISKRNQSIVLKLPRRLSAHVDPQYIRMVIENLVSNASKYSPDNTSITLSVKGTKAHITISVQDHGIGISLEDQKKLYKKFSRIYNDQSVAEGNGLGLYWSKKIVELHGGELVLISEPDRGSTFKVVLPTLPQS